MLFGIIFDKSIFGEPTHAFWSDLTTAPPKRDADLQYWLSNRAILLARPGINYCMGCYYYMGTNIETVVTKSFVVGVLRSVYLYIFTNFIAWFHDQIWRCIILIKYNCLTFYINSVPSMWIRWVFFRRHSTDNASKRNIFNFIT